MTPWLRFPPQPQDADMRVAIWLLTLFAVAVVVALFAGNNQGTVTVYLPPYRVDLSLNLVLLVLAVGFVILHLALRALDALLTIPQRAHDWRLVQRERTIYASLLDAWFHLLSGRFVRARKAAELVVSIEESMQRSGEKLPHAGRVRGFAHMLAAEGAHAVQDRTRRESHFDQALAQVAKRDVQDAREGVQMRAARWALDDKDAGAAMQWLDQLPVGAARRTIALRLRFKAARLSGKSKLALETARQLTKHRALSEVAGRSIARGLAAEMIAAAHDPVQIQMAWDALNPDEQGQTDVVLEAAARLLQVGGEVDVALRWLLPVWNAMAQSDNALTPAQQVQLVRVLEAGFDKAGGVPDSLWLGRIENAQMARPHDAVLQYLAGCMCRHLSLWGKAQQMLTRALPRLQDTELKRDAWRTLAQLAEQRNDAAAAAQAYQEAARL
jgi:HemY protein